MREWDIRSELNSIDPRRVGLLGGTFDPIHHGHLQMAQDALELRGLDEVCLIPCATPPHKRDALPSSAEHRLAMIDAAIAEDPRFSRSVIELERGGVSYTINTIRILQRSAPEIEFFFIFGGDTLFELYSWKEVDKLIDNLGFIAVARPGSGCDEIDAESLRLRDDQVEILKQSLLFGHAIDISSTDVRARVAEGLGVKYLLPAPVAEYIERHGLYRAM